MESKPTKFLVIPYLVVKHSQFNIKLGTCSIVLSPVYIWYYNEVSYQKIRFAFSLETAIGGSSWMTRKISILRHNYRKNGVLRNTGWQSKRRYYIKETCRLHMTSCHHDSFASYTCRYCNEYEMHNLNSCLIWNLDYLLSVSQRRNKSSFICACSEDTKLAENILFLPVFLP
jgi:hypothetical protein